MGPSAAPSRDRAMLFFKFCFACDAAFFPVRRDAKFCCGGCRQACYRARKAAKATDARRAADFEAAQWSGKAGAPVKGQISPPDRRRPPGDARERRAEPIALICAATLAGRPLSRWLGRPPAAPRVNPIGCFAQIPDIRRTAWLPLNTGRYSSSSSAGIAPIDTEVVTAAHVGSSLPACSRTMYSA